MKLCYITREAPPNLMGGIGTYVANMTEVLAAEGHEVTLITQWHPEAPKRGIGEAHITDAGVRVYYLPFVDAQWAVDAEIACPEVMGLAQLDISSVFAWAVAEALEVLIPRHHLEYIEAPEYEAPLSIFLNRRASRSADDPIRRPVCAVHLHSPSHLIFENNDEDVGLPWMQHRKRFELEAIAMADGVLGPSQYLASQVISELSLPPETISVIPYPLGQPLPEPSSIPEQRDGFHCLFVGRIEPRKGVFEWVEAACEVLATHPDTYFRFVGGPHLRETRDNHGGTTTKTLQALIPERLRRNFLFHEQIPREDLGTYYHQADCCVVPSRWDNFPNTCIEAMRCGKLVLASNQGGMAEMIEHRETGLLASTTYGDRVGLKDALREGLLQAIAMPRQQRELIGGAARKQIEKLCDNTSVLSQHARWREQLASVSTRPTASAPRPLREEAQATLKVAVLLTAEASAESIRSTLQSLAEQPADLVQPVIIGSIKTGVFELPECAHDWATIDPAADLSDPMEGFSKKTLHRLLAESSRSKQIVFLTPGMRLRPEFAERCSHFFNNLPTAGFCLPWIYSADKENVIARSGANESELLLSPKDADLFAVLQIEPLRACLTTSPTGCYLSDILRDLMLRLNHAGYPGRILPEVLGETSTPVDPLCLTSFSLHHRADSYLQLLHAHQSKLDTRLLFHQRIASQLNQP